MDWNLHMLPKEMYLHVLPKELMLPNKVLSEYYD